MAAAAAEPPDALLGLLLDTALVENRVCPSVSCGIGPVFLGASAVHRILSWHAFVLWGDSVQYIKPDAAADRGLLKFLEPPDALLGVLLDTALVENRCAHQ